MPEDINEQDVIKNFEEFLLNFRLSIDENKPRYIYRDAIFELVTSEDSDRRSLVVDFNDLVLYSPELADLLRYNPKQILHLFTEGFRNVILKIREDIQKEDLCKYFLRIKDAKLWDIKEIKDIYRPENLGKIIVIDGIIVDKSKVEFILRRGYFRCQVCGYIFPKEFEFFMIPPDCCENPACDNTTKFTLLNDGILLEHFQELVIKDLQDEDKKLSKAKVYILGDLTNKFEMGDTIRITGIIEAIPTKKIQPYKIPTFNIFINALYIEKINQDIK